MVNRTSLSLPLLLSVNGGYVDTAGFLALQGLFTAHVTGNFVTIGAALAFGTAGVLNKLLALPVFCAVIIATRLAFTSKSASARPVLPGVLNLKLALLIVGAVLAVTLGPFKEADGWAAIVTGMTFVAAMAIQNAAHRIHMPGAPPTTLMTGTTTQIMIDLADMIRGFPPEARNAARARQAYVTRGRQLRGGRGSGSDSLPCRWNLVLRRRAGGCGARKNIRAARITNAGERNNLANQKLGRFSAIVRSPFPGDNPRRQRSYRSC